MPALRIACKTNQKETQSKWHRCIYSDQTFGRESTRFGRLIMGKASVVKLSDRQKSGKRIANNYCIQINPHYMQKILAGFRGEGSAQFFRQHTDELWEPIFSQLSIAEYGAWRRLLAMFARSREAIKQRCIVVTAKELRMHGISLHVLRRLATNMPHVEISLLTESGEIRDL